MTVSTAQIKRIMLRAKINAIPHDVRTHERHIALARIMSRSIQDDFLSAVDVYGRAMKRAGHDVYSAFCRYETEDIDASLAQRIIVIMLNVYDKRCAITGNIPLDEMESIAHGEYAPAVTIARRIRTKGIDHDTD